MRNTPASATTTRVRLNSWGGTAASPCGISELAPADATSQKGPSARAAALARAILTSPRPSSGAERAALSRLTASLGPAATTGSHIDSWSGSTASPFEAPLVDVAFLNGGLHAALRLLSEQASPSASSFAPLLEAAIGRDDEPALVEVASVMRRRGVAPDAGIFTTVIEARLRTGQPDRATAACLHALDRGIVPRARSLTALVTALADADQTSAAITLCARLRARGTWMSGRSAATEALVRAAARSAGAPFEAVAVAHELAAHAAMEDAARGGRAGRGGDGTRLAREAAGGRVLVSTSFQQGAMLLHCLREGNLYGARALASYTLETGARMPAHAVGAMIGAEYEAMNLVAARALLKEAESRGLWRLPQRGISLGPAAQQAAPASLPSGAPPPLEPQQRVAHHAPSEEVRLCPTVRLGCGRADPTQAARIGEDAAVLDLRGLPEGVARVGTLHFFIQLTQRLEAGLDSEEIAQLLQDDASPPPLGSASAVARAVAGQPGARASPWSWARSPPPGARRLPAAVEIWTDLGGGEELRQLCADMHPPLLLQLSPSAGGATGGRLIANPAAMRRWASQVARRQLARRRGAQFGVLAMGHNLFYAGTFIAAGGAGFLM